MEHTTSEDSPVQLEDFENEEDLELTAVECPSPTINKIVDITKMQEGTSKAVYTNRSNRPWSSCPAPAIKQSNGLQNIIKNGKIRLLLLSIRKDCGQMSVLDLRSRKHLNKNLMAMYRVLLSESQKVKVTTMKTPILTLMTVIELFKEVLC
ncbi:hypothetical protein DAPPUDRAFT_117085 [Daphnia pulex]|uniref:UPF0033 domain-containing protein n=1 Tax=Daphnia pulex TaxID=6669 RepID=E9HRH2_DAPPU|nr:hypothetical protein DAPPUDRAFT_117085 [Daphnia pulex]|eukprot:EFX65644.1 hypothetical protein DAPPUDRAFT_117085 [Daphnia pulex]